MDDRNRLEAIKTVASLEWTKLLRGRQLILSVLALAVVLAATLLARNLAENIDPPALLEQTLSMGFFGMLAFLLPFLFASGAISDEVERRIFTFVLCRPMSRQALFSGKLLTAILACVALLTTASLLLHVIVFMPELGSVLKQFPATARATAALCGLAVCYCCLALCFGALSVRASSVLIVMYLALIEFSLGYILPGAARMVSMNYHARQLAGLPKGGLFAPELTPDLPMWMHLSALIAVSLAFYLFGILAFRYREYQDS